MGSSGVPIPFQYGGAVERHVYDLARFLAKRNCQVHIFTMKTKTTIKSELVENVHVLRGGFFEERLNISKTLWKHVVFFLFVLANSLCIETDIIHAHNGIPGLAALFAAKIRGIPFIFTSHTPYTSVHHRIGGEIGVLKNRFEDFQVALERFCARNASCVIAVSAKVREGLFAIGISEKNVYLVPNGVDTQKFRQDSNKAAGVREKFQLKRSAIMLYVGRIAKSKGLDYLIASAPQVVQRHPDVKFVIVGPISYYSTNVPTPYYQELRKKIELQQLSGFFLFTGAVDENDLVGFYSACDMLILPSVSEAFGMVLAEAMSCGKPVIGSRIDGIVDVINNGEDGYLVGPRKPEEIASKINHLLERPNERRDMGEAAKKHVEKMFDWNVLAPRIMEIYCDAIREKKEK